MLKIMGFPGEYIQGAHALRKIGDIAIRYQFKKIGIIFIIIFNPINIEIPINVAPLIINKNSPNNAIINAIIRYNNGFIFII